MRLTRERLAELQQKHLAHLDWRTIFTYDTLPPEHIDTLDAYFHAFLAPTSPYRCPGCDRIMKGGIETLLGFLGEETTSLEWKLTSGEAACSKCSYPFRVLHGNVGPIKHLAMTLAYHPSELSFPSDEHAARGDVP